ncbi:MAG TPA: dipeptide/oligopeptide/nickel ABC transporter permease/ATP-binding protein [Rhodocyclaceae bacterium]|nr:dipeptide/oligopeptide/nickel ABC transporter permease/ATP-binding protein [Rhodocyclaceae bacterium]
MSGNRLAWSGAALVAALVAVALAAPLLPLADPHATDLAARMRPIASPDHPLGTDHLGRDTLARLVWGTRTSLAVGVFAVSVAALIGTAIGLVAGYLRGWSDTLLMRSIDVLLAFPYLLLALAIVAVLGPGLVNAMIAVAVVNIPFFARTVRGTVLELAERGFVDAARIGGAGHVRILVRELLPNVLPVVVIMMSTNLGWMILETAGLSFLGLGAQPPAADLGSMLGAGREFLTTVPRQAILPGVVIMLLVVGINLAGDGLRDALDPRRRGAGETAAGGASVPVPVPVKVPAAATHGSAGRATHTGAAATADAAIGPDDPAAAVSATASGGAALGPPAAALLRVTALSTHFHLDGRIHRAVDDVSFALAPGERVAIVGESGCGKTVLALSLLGLVPPAARIVAGHIEFDGEALLCAPAERRRRLRGDRIAYVPQDPMGALNPVLTVGAQLVETMRAHRTIDRADARIRAAQLLEQVRIPHPAARLAAYPHELSGGMRQRVLIAMALANDPALIIADEPTTALDVTVQTEILRLIGTLCDQRGTALLLISHDLGAVARLAGRALVLYAGRVVEEGPLDALLAQPAHPYTRALLACAPELGRPDKAIAPIAGQPPPLDALPAGCHFAPRCEHVRPACRADSIPLRPFGASRRVRCVRAEELAR